MKANADDAEDEKSESEDYFHLIIYHEVTARAEPIRNVSPEITIKDLKLEIEKIFHIDTNRQELNIFVDECNQTTRLCQLDDDTQMIGAYRERLNLNSFGIAVIDLTTVAAVDQVMEGMTYNELINVLNQCILKGGFPNILIMEIASMIYGNVKSGVCIKYKDGIYVAQDDTFGIAVYRHFGIRDKERIINKFNYKRLRRYQLIGEQEIFLKSSRNTMGGTVTVIVIPGNNTKKYETEDDCERYTAINLCMMQLVKEYTADDDEKEENVKYIQLFIKTLTGKTITMQNVNVNGFVFALKQQLQDKEGYHPLTSRLIFGGKQLSDMKLLSDYGIVDESTLHLVLRLR